MDMKKLLTILLTSISIIIYSQIDMPYKYNFWDTITIKQPFILQNGDTCSIFLVNDSICMKCNSGDTVRIDGTTVDLSNYPDRTELGDTASAVETRANDYTSLYADSLQSQLFNPRLHSLSKLRVLFGKSEDTTIWSNEYFYWNTTVNSLYLRKDSVGGSSNIGNCLMYTEYNDPNYSYDIIRSSISHNNFDPDQYTRWGLSAIIDLDTIKQVLNSDIHKVVGVYGYLRRSKTATNGISIEHSSNNATLAGVYGQLSSEINDLTTGTGTYQLAAVMGRDLSTGTAKSYGVYSDGNSLTVGNHYTDGLFVDNIGSKDSDSIIVDSTIYFAGSIKIKTNIESFSVSKTISFDNQYYAEMTITNNTVITISNIPEGTSPQLALIWSGGNYTCSISGATQMSGNSTISLQETNGATDLIQFKKINGTDYYSIINIVTP